MSSNLKVDQVVRDHILSSPQAILDDTDLMRALVAAEDAARGNNVVDLRSVAMDQLEIRLGQLEETHRSVIAAVYDNLAGTNMIHRAIVELLDPPTFDAFLDALAGPLADTLRVDTVRLLLETAGGREDHEVAGANPVLGVAEMGYCSLYAGLMRTGAPRTVTLRGVAVGDPDVHGERAAHIRSEACLLLDLGAGRLPGMVVLGAEDPRQFADGQGTDLLQFFTAVFERNLRRWLS